MKNIIHHIDCEIYKQEIKVTFSIEAFRKATGNYNIADAGGLTSYRDGNLVIYINADAEGMKPSTLAHEAYHAIDFMFADRNADYNREGMNEHWAYAIGWLAEKIVDCHTAEMRYKPA